MKRSLIVLALIALFPSQGGAIGADFQAGVVCTSDLAGCVPQAGWGVLWVNARTEDFARIRDYVTRGVTCDQDLVDRGICTVADGEPLDTTEAKAYALDWVMRSLRAAALNESIAAHDEANPFVDPGDGIGEEP